MIEFENLQDIWSQQSTPKQADLAANIIAKAEDNKREMTSIHRATMVILAVTAIGIVICFSSVNIQKISQPLVGILMMLGSMVLRLIMELVSYKRFKKVDILADFKTYTHEIAHFYRFRKMVQFVITPLSLLAYGIGFCLLLPNAKHNVSTAFFAFIIGSALVFSAIITIIIVRQNRKEIDILDFLSNAQKHIEK
jgi:hypothetical protein